MSESGDRIKENERPVKIIWKWSGRKTWQIKLQAGNELEGKG